jgi:hypothetical protein
MYVCNCLKPDETLLHPFSTPRVAFCLAYTPDHSRGTTRGPAFSLHSRKVLAVQVRPHTYEFHPCRLGLAGWFFLLARSQVVTHVFQRISAPLKVRERCKLSVIAEASSHFFPSLPSERLSPFSDHFHPAATDDSRIGIPSARPEARRRGSPFLAMNVLPHDEQVCHVRISDPL